MKKYYNIHVNLSETIETVSFAVHTDEAYGKELLAAARFDERLRHYEDNFDDLKVSIYYHVADIFIAQHHQQLAIDPTAPTVLHTICNLPQKDYYNFDYYEEEDFGSFLINDGIKANDDSMIKLGLFRFFIHDIEIEILVEPKSHTKCTLPSVLEFDSANYAKHLQQQGEKAYYCANLMISDLYGDLIEEFDDYTINVHPYLGEMLLSDASNGLCGGLMDSLKWRAAELLLEQHARLKDGTGWDDETPLERFWAMALDEGEIDDEEYEEILTDISNRNYIENIYEIIDSYDMLSLEGRGYTIYSEGDIPYSITYED